MRLTPLRYTTELAWYFLTKGSSLYPGWTDLLLRMSVYSPGQDDSQATRPTWSDLQAIAVRARHILRPMAEESYRRALDASGDRRQPSDGRASPDFHDAVASLLVAQSRALQSFRRTRSVFSDLAEAAASGSDGASPRQDVARRMKHMHDLPPASAFVTSLDLELEMALWRVGEKFVVMMPVHVTRDGGEGAFHWFEAVVEPSDEPAHADGGSGEGTLPEKLVAPQEWHVVLGRSREGREHLPTVVRLTGSPLMELPTADRPVELNPWRRHLRELCTHPQPDAEMFMQSSAEIVSGIESLRGIDPSTVQHLVGEARHVFDWVEAENGQVGLAGQLAAESLSAEQEVDQDGLRHQQGSLRLLSKRLPEIPEGPDPFVRGMEAIGTVASSDEVGSPGLVSYHAVILDEYSAVQTSHAELVGAVQVRDSASFQPSLPAGLVANKPFVPRFWLAFGVQLAEPAIRYRLFSQVTSATVRDSVTGDSVGGPVTNAALTASAASPRDGNDSVRTSEDGEPDRSLGYSDSAVSAPMGYGLAVNSSLDEVDMDLLRWMGFAVVEDDCEIFSADIRDLAKHTIHVMRALEELSLDGQQRTDGSGRKGLRRGPSDVFNSNQYRRPRRGQCINGAAGGLR